jgi:hypothetical protein
MLLENFRRLIPEPKDDFCFSIDAISVTMGARTLKADYTIELAQDLAQFHGAGAVEELSKILRDEILSEVTQEVRKHYDWINK